MKKLLLSSLITAALVSLALPTPAQTNSLPPIPTDQATFLSTALGYFTSFNTNLAGTFTNKGTFWTGVDSIVGAGPGGASIANEICFFSYVFTTVAGEGRLGKA